jgi:hypothetical protein
MYEDYLSMYASVLWPISHLLIAGICYWPRTLTRLSASILILRDLRMQ